MAWRSWYWTRVAALNGLVCEWINRVASAKASTSVLICSKLGMTIVSGCQREPSARRRCESGGASTAGSNAGNTSAAVSAGGDSFAPRA